MLRASGRDENAEHAETPHFVAPDAQIETQKLRSTDRYDTILNRGSTYFSEFLT